MHEACGDDADLQARVRELLAAHEAADDFLTSEPPLSPEIEAELGRLKPEEEGERIANYKLLQQIGEGGFGTVWMADQLAPVQRRVALKIIKLGMDTQARSSARFEAGAAGAGDDGSSGHRQASSTAGATEYGPALTL